MNTINKIISPVERRPPPRTDGRKMGNRDIYIVCYSSANYEPYLIREITALVKTHLGEREEKRRASVS